MVCGPSAGEMKFNVDRVARGKLGPANIGGVLCNSDGVVLIMFFKYVGCMESKEAKVVAILEALQIFVSTSFLESPVMEGNSLNAISSVSLRAIFPWRFQFYSTRSSIYLLCFNVKFQHVGRMGNGFVDSLVKQGVDRSSDLFSFTM